MEDVAKRVWPE